MATYRNKNFISDIDFVRDVSEGDARAFPCKKCGRQFTARPPYEGYELALTKPCSRKDHDSPQLYECEDCNHRNVIYWCQGK
jgi:hypothetical protein